jgi:Mg-chelatase subunit ChlD
MLTFSQPTWLLLLLALPGIWWLALRMSYASLGPYQRWISLAVRIVVWVLLAGALAGVQFVRKSDRLSVVVVRDASDSVDDPQLAAVMGELEDARKTMRKDDSLGKVNFAAEAKLEFLPKPGVDDRQLADWQTIPHTNFTNIGEALQLAVASFPDNAQKRLVLITDGNENSGNALAEARLARDNGVELMTVALPTRSGPEVVLSSLEAPGTASMGETVNVRFVLDSTVATPATVTLIRNGEFVDKQRISVRPGKEVYEFPVTIDQSGFFTYELAVEPQVDTIAQNNRAYAFSVVGGRPRLLYATGDPNEARYLPQTLLAHNIAVDVVPPAAIPYNLADFQLYDGIIFSDVAAYDISDEQMKMVQTLVRDYGRGFMMIGGEKSFGPGGYFDTSIEQTLPVDMDFRRKKLTPSTLVVCLVDKSGSMGEEVSGVQKVVMAREACKAVVKLQQADDWVGVMGFDAVGQWVVEPAKGINKNDTLAKLSSMQAGGGTDLYPALKAAYEASKNVPAQIKHFLVFTDGIVAPADFAGLAKELVADNVTISTVAFGTDADVQFLKDLAMMGKGNAYTANSLYELPKIFTREVFLASKATLNEEPFAARPASDSPLVSSIGWSSAPLLYGYVATSLKDHAQAPLLTAKDDPLLAVWRYGLGKAAAFTSDAKNRWARDWLGWSGYSRFWTGVARWIKSDLSSGGMTVTTSVSGNEGVIQANVVGAKGEFVNLSRLEAYVTDPKLEGSTLDLRQVAPGEYEGRFPIKDNGNYFVNVVQMQPDGSGGNVPAAAQASGLAVSYSPEYRELEPNTFLLNQLQSTSLLPEGVDMRSIFTRQRKPQRRLEDAWELFTLIALLLWLLDVASRRLVLNWQEWQAVFAAAAYGAAARRAAQTRESLAGLLTAKRRAFTPRGRRTAADLQADMPWQTLDASTESAARQVAAQAQRQSAPDKIGAPPAALKTKAAAPGLSDLRRRMETRERLAPNAPGRPPQPSPIGPSAVVPAAPPRDAPTPEPAKAADLGAREFTSRLLAKKKQRGGGG